MRALADQGSLLFAIYHSSRRAALETQEVWLNKRFLVYSPFLVEYCLLIRLRKRWQESLIPWELGSWVFGTVIFEQIHEGLGGRTTESLPPSRE